MIEPTPHARQPEQREGSASRIPTRKGPRQLWLAALNLAIVRDARATREVMLFEGWAEADAAAAYLEWLHDQVDAAAAEGWWTP
jgi:hypothetical protein